MSNLDSRRGGGELDVVIEGWHQQGPPWYYLLQYLAHGQADRENPHVLP